MASPLRMLGFHRLTVRDLFPNGRCRNSLHLSDARIKAEIASYGIASIFSCGAKIACFARPALPAQEKRRPMNKSRISQLKSLMTVVSMALAAAVLLAPADASAVPYIIKLTQQGNNVVALGSGSFDLAGLTNDGSTTNGPIGMQPDISAIGTGATPATLDAYSGTITGPASFGSGGGALASSGNGDFVEIFADSSPGLSFWVPSGYVSGNALSSSATWDNATFASLGVTPGTYVWTWGTAVGQSFTLDVVKPAGVPEPAALGMFGFGTLLIGALVGLRRHVA